MTDDRCPAALGVYLGEVADALARRCIGVAAVRVPAPGPQQALTGCIELDPATARPGLGWGPVTAGWHEELGWWAELHSGSAARRSRRYLPSTAAGDVAPYPTVVADFLAGLARGEDLGSMAPALHRYRLLADPHELLDRLAHPGARSAHPAPGYRP